MRFKMSLTGGQILRTDSKVSLWKTICHCTRRSGEKKELAWTGSWSLSWGPAGRPAEERQIEEVSRENKRRRSGDGASDHLWSRTSLRLRASNQRCARAYVAPRASAVVRGM